MKTTFSVSEIFLILWNTLIFNVRVFGFKGCFKPKVLIGPYAKFGHLHKGAVDVQTDKIAMIGVGVGSFMKGKKDTTFINISQEAVLKIKGKVRFCRGCKINLSPGAILEVGNNFRANAGCVFSVVSSLVIAEDVHIGWESELFDDDGHDLKAKDEGRVLNETRAIVIGSNVWVASRSAILKGVEIAHDVVIPYGSVIVKSCKDSNVIFGGMPNRVLKEGLSVNFNDIKRNL